MITVEDLLRDYPTIVSTLRNYGSTDTEIEKFTFAGPSMLRLLERMALEHVDLVNKVSIMEGRLDSVLRVLRDIRSERQSIATATNSYAWNSV